MAVIMSKGIKVSHLFASKVFYVEFDFDDWPTTHHNDKYSLKPYDGTFFLLRDKFKEVFPEDSFDTIEAQKANGSFSMCEDTSNIKQIKYSINFLTQTGFYIMDECAHGDKNKQTVFNNHVNIMEILKGTEELEMFDTDVIQ